MRLHVAMMGHILGDLHVLRGTHATLRPGVAKLPALLEPSHEAMDNGQAGIPPHVLRAGHGAGLWLWLWSWLLMRKLEGLVDVPVSCY